MKKILDLRKVLQQNVVYKEILDLVYPRHCAVCDSTLWGQYEMYLCMDCFYNLPLIDIYDTSMNNLVGKVFWGRCNFDFCWGWMEYRSGSKTSQIVKELKYKGNPAMAEHLGKLMGENLLEMDALKRHNVQLIPVPMSPEKRKKRGYNQTEEIAKGISSVCGFKVQESIIERRVMRDSQTRMNRISRFENMAGVFGINHAALSEEVRNDIEGKEKSTLLLIVDDIITTGATIETCYRALLSQFNVRIGVCALGLTNR